MSVEVEADVVLRAQEVEGGEGELWRLEVLLAGVLLAQQLQRLEDEVSELRTDAREVLAAQLTQLEARHMVVEEVRDLQVLDAVVRGPRSYPIGDVVRLPLFGRAKRPIGSRALLVLEAAEGLVEREVGEREERRVGGGEHVERVNRFHGVEVGVGLARVRVREVQESGRRRERGVAVQSQHSVGRWRSASRAKSICCQLFLEKEFPNLESYRGVSY